MSAALHQANPDTTDKPVVAIFRTRLLPLSETFIRDQAVALQRWSPVLVGERSVDKLSLGGLASRTAFRGEMTLAQRVIGFANRLMHRPPFGLLSIVRRCRPSLLHAHFAYDGVEVWPIAHRLGIPLLVTLHGSDVTTHMAWFAEGHAGLRWRAYPERLRRMSVQPHVHFVAVSKNIQRAAVAAGLPLASITVTPIGIDVDRFARTGPAPSQRGPVVLFVGRLVEKKGGIYLAEAFERVQRHVPAARLLIAGDGPERARIAARLSQVDNVEFLGAVDHEKVLRLLQEARVFCLPSITLKSGEAEGLPIVLLEAQACGVPVVTSARGGVDEGIAPGRTGFAFAEKDVDALADHITQLLTDDLLADRCSDAGPVYVREHHDIQEQTRKLERLYDDLAFRKTSQRQE